MIDVSDCKVQWDRGAALQVLVNSTTRTLWVGEQVYGGTVAGAVRFFKSRPVEEQDRIEMFLDAGVIEGVGETIIGADVLRVLGDRPDLPEK
jgi:hypothetical protein